MTSRITKQTTFEEFSIEARRLRSLADEAEADFLSYLYEAEQVPSLWKGTGYTFVQFLDNTNLCKATRYLNYKTAREGLGVRGITGVGVHAVVAAGRFQDPAKQREVVEEARAWEETNGTTISEQSASRIGRDLRSRQLGARLGHKSYATVAKELDAAREEIDRLRAENMALREEIAQLRKDTASEPAPASRRRGRRSGVSVEAS